MKGFAKGGKKGKDAKGFPGGGPGGFPAKGYGKSGGKGEMDTWQMGQMSMKGKSKSPFGDGKAGKGFSPKGQMGKDSFGKDGGKAKGQSAELAVSGCWHETVGSIIRGEYFRSGSNHGRPVYKKLGPGQEVQIYFWDSRDGPNMCGWWFGASVGGDMVWSFRPGPEGQTPPRSGWKVPFEGQVDPTLAVNALQPRNGQAPPAPPARALPAAPPPKEVGGDTHIVVSGCSHAVVGTIVNGSYVRTAENHGKPVYKKTEQTKDGVDVHIYFWDDKQNPTFCGWWFGPRVGAEEVWAYNPGRMLGTAPLGGWKVPYDGPVDTNFAISVDRKASDEDRRLKKEAAAKIQAEAARAAKQIRLVAQKLATVKIETLESLEEELTAVLDKELEACGDEKAKVKEECDKALEQARSRVEQQKEAKVKAAPMLEELDGRLTTAEAALKKIEAKVTDRLLKEADEAVEACASCLVEGGAVLTMGEGFQEKLKRLQECKKALRKSQSKKKVEAGVAQMAKYDANKDGMLEKAELKKYAQAELKCTLTAASVDGMFRLLTAEGAKGVRTEDFQRAKVQVGILREKKIDLERKKRREEREKELEKLKDKLKGRIEEITKAIDEIELSCTQLQEAAEALKAPDQKPSELIAKLDSIEATSEEANQKIASSRKAMFDAKEEADAEVVQWLEEVFRPMYSKLKTAERATAQSSQFTKRQRMTADQRNREELEKLARRALAIIRQFQKAKDVSNDDVFAKMATSGEESAVDESSFLSFFGECEKESTNGDAADFPSKEDLQRLFTFWDEAGNGSLNEERVAEILRRFMKVVGKTAITDGVSIKANSLRKLEVGDVVEVLGPPTKEPEVDVMRVQVRLLADGTEGWATISGNQGTDYLQDGGGTFKVVKETLLTDDFEIGAAKETPKEDRRLKLGEIVEARSWMKKHEESGLTRIRCRATSDGAVGWATVVGNQGTVYLEAK